MHVFFCTVFCTDLCMRCILPFHQALKHRCFHASNSISRHICTVAVMICSALNAIYQAPLWRHIIGTDGYVFVPFCPDVSIHLCIFFFETQKQCPTYFILWTFSCRLFCWGVYVLILVLNISVSNYLVETGTKYGPFVHKQSKQPDKRTLTKGPWQAILATGIFWML